MGHRPHLLLPPPWTTPSLPLQPDHEHHLLRVLRLADGSEVTYTDGAGVFGSGHLVAGLVKRGDETLCPPPSVELTMAVAPPRDRDRVRFLVEKLAELEVQKLLWLRTRFGQGAPPLAGKSRAWAVGALEQSRGTRTLQVGEGWVDLAELIGPAWPGPLLLADQGGEEIPHPVPSPVTIAVGPEGGFAADEIPPQVRRFTLGRTVLRVETAAIVAAGILTR